MDKSTNRLAIIGGYPPPHGGMTTHLRRLRAALERCGVEFVVYNTISSYSQGDRVRSVARFRTLWGIRYLFTGREHSVYVLSGNLNAWVFAALLAELRHKRVWVQVPNARLGLWVETKSWRARVAGWALRRADCVVCVSPELADAVSAVGVPSEQIKVAPRGSIGG